MIEIATIGTRAVSAICDIPGLNFLKPAVGMVGLICETAKTVNSNGVAARALASHAQDVTNSVVNRATALHGGKHGDLTTLCRALDEVQGFLQLLRHRPRIKSWIFAAKEQERFAELNSALERALAVFSVCSCHP
ncbi:hypothetical protein B0H19DRAFT_99459 [Mycena capillaripes]|nr:hypothetical protein B0H19DRAFT_99459 [Mycena capillaripes]